MSIQSILRRQGLLVPVPMILVRFREAPAFHHGDFAWGVWGEMPFPPTSPLLKGRSSWTLSLGETIEG
jgi:hypothetical protein